MYTLNFIKYYVELITTWVSKYVTYLYDTFMEFSVIIKIAAISVTFSLGLILFTILRILWNGRKNRNERKRYKKLDEKYGKGIRYIMSAESGSNLTRQEIIDALELDNPDRNKKDLLKNKKEKLTFSRLVYNIRISDEASLGKRKNLHILLDIFDIQSFLENTVNKAPMRLKVEALTMLRAFKMPINQWIANQLRTSKRSRVKRLAMYASIMSASNSDLEYFESEYFDNNCCTYDEIQLGYVMSRRIAMNRKLPNLAQMAMAHHLPGTQAMFVRLMRQFDQKEYCAELEELFSSTNDKNLIQEIARTWGYLKYVPGEQAMQDIILTQPDDNKIAIMHALTRLNTGRSLSTLVDGYVNSGNQNVRYEALRCLFYYGPTGRAKFRELEPEAPEIDKRLFEFFSNPITVKETRLSKDDIYEAEEDNLYSVA